MLRKPEAGNTIPIVLVTTADGQKGLGVFSYKTLSEDTRGAVRDLRKALEGVDVTGGGAATADQNAGGSAEPTAAPGLLCEEREWTNAAGNKMRAAVVRLNGSTVTFRLPGDRTVEYPLHKLSDVSQQELRKLGTE
jgi:hypothetical protein